MVADRYDLVGDTRDGDVGHRDQSDSSSRSDVVLLVRQFTRTAFFLCIWYNMSMHGFTLIEILVSLAILAVIVTVALQGVTQFRASSDLDSASEQAVSFLSEARGKTLASKGDTQYGVRFNLNTFVLFSGGSFASSTAGNKAYPLPGDIEISSIALAGGVKDVLFERLTGDTAGIGTITFRIKNNISHTRTVTLSGTGLIKVQ